MVVSDVDYIVPYEVYWIPKFSKLFCIAVEFLIT